MYESTGEPGWLSKKVDSFMGPDDGYWLHQHRLELVLQEQGDEEDLMLAALRELGEVYQEEAWSEEEFEAE